MTGQTDPAPPPAAAAPPDPAAILRSRSYLRLLVLAAILGVPISAVAYFFLALISHLQGWIFTDLPTALGFDSEPLWWPLPPLLLAGVLVSLVIRYLPGRGGHSPADGFHTGGAPARPIDLPGIALAALAGLALGAVIGPEAPLIALGGGLAVCAVRLLNRDVPNQTAAVVAAAGSFAAISTLLGSPLVAAFLMMEAAGLGGAMMGLVLVPGLLAAGIGYLIFIGLDSWTGLGTFSLGVPQVAPLARPQIGEFAWAVAIGLAAALLSWGIRWLALTVRPHIERRILIITPVVGLAIAGLAILYAHVSGHATSDVLFSGQDALAPLVDNSSEFTAGALVLLVTCKGFAYSASLAGFRGGPIFPSMFIGAAGGMALSHLAGLPLVAGVGMGMAAMTCGMLGLPLTSVLITSVFMADAGINLLPLLIVAVVVAYVASARLIPARLPSPKEPPADPAEGPVDAPEPARA